MVSKMHEIHGNQFSLGRISKMEGWRVYHVAMPDPAEYHKIEFESEADKTMFLLRYANTE
jgi:hypothetical protein